MVAKSLSIVLLAISFSLPAFAQLSKNISLPVRASATPVGNKFHVVLAWQKFNDSVRVQIHRKDPDATNWGAVIATLDSGENRFTDTAILPNRSYDYRVTRTSSQPAIGYINSGYYNTAKNERAGSIALIIDETYKDSLSSEIHRLYLDLLGDGWKVHRRYVKRTDTIPAVKQLILDIKKVDADLSTVFLLGQVPVPYSGNIRPDGHPDHEGAWPADGFYGDIDGDWTDGIIQNFVATRTENHNLVGDGKYDQSIFPSPVELNVGRVSFVRLPTFTDGEYALMRRYLKKNHEWRSGNIGVPRRALIDDNFGSFEIGSSSWRGFYPLVDTGNIVSNPEFDFRTDLNKDAYLFAGGAGAGGYNSCAGVITSGQFASDSIKAVFVSLAGSYFGDWDASGNLLRAAIASSPYAVASFWGGIPNWVLYPMGMNETIGHCARLTMNNAGTYAGNFNFSQRMVHIGLMGDPTLVAYPGKIVRDLKIDSVGRGRISLKWSPAQVGQMFSYVYRSFNLDSGFTLMEISQDGFFSDSLPKNNRVYYMVRALQTVTTPSGRFGWLSKGIIDSIDIVGVNVPSIKKISGVSLWPNPTVAELRIKAGEILSDCQWSIYDLSGRKINSGTMHGREFQINTAELPAGLYILKMAAREGTWEGKFTKTE